MTDVPTIIMIAIAAYLLGSIPFGIPLSKLFGLPDPRTIGSGNIGATNVLRSGSKVAAFLTLVLDAGKGGIAVVAAKFIFGDVAAPYAAFFAFLGHLYPVWLRFKGGKGVATWLGTLFPLALIPFLAAGALWLATFAITRISSLSALVASALTPIVALFLGQSSIALVCLVMSALIWWKHRANIGRLLNGTEPKSSFGSKSTEDKH